MTSPGREGTGHSAADYVAAGQEFLFHLYRGSALLEDNHVEEAKHELERALAHQPQDTEGQALLGVVYFRLGHYPRAIQIFEELVRELPEEVPPRVNLGLCYLKTGQVREARLLLEEVVTRRPDHLRAWGYLGLAFQRLGDFEKAAVAFESAGKPELAARLRPAPPVDREPEPPESALQELSPDAAPPLPRPSDAPRTDESSPASVRGRTIPAPGTEVILPRQVSRFVRENHLVFPESPRVVVHTNGTALVRVETAFAYRPDCVISASTRGPVTRQPAYRRRGDRKGNEPGEPLGGSVHPLVWLEGLATMVLAPPRGRKWLALAMNADEPLFVREDHVVGLEHTVDHLAGRLPLPTGDSVPLLRLTGSGVALLATAASVSALEVEGTSEVAVRADRVAGWTGRVVPVSDATGDGNLGGRGLLGFAGEGAVLVELD
jgi:hypothetical protein